MRCCVVFRMLIVLAAAINATADSLHAAERSVPEIQQHMVKLFGAGVGTLDSYGSGVLVGREGHVVTVWNHLVGTGFLTAVVPDGRRFSVSVVGTSGSHDLAVLKLNCEPDETFAGLDLQAAVAAEAGQPVLAFSNMFHVATGNEPVSVVHGVVAAHAPLQAGLGRWKLPVKSPVYVIDAVINNSGAAGGLLTDPEGRPLGLIGREIRHQETGMWVNYAVPWTLLQPVIDGILQGDRRTDDGATDADADRNLVSHQRLTSDFGLTLVPSVLKKTPAYLDRIIPDSPAAAAGLRRGDLVLMVDDRVIQSTEDLRSALADQRTGQRVILIVNRRSQLQNVTLRIP